MKGLRETLPRYREKALRPLLRHRFMRGLMRSQARLTYEQVQEARDGRPNDFTRPLLEPIMRDGTRVAPEPELNAARDRF